MNSDDIIRRLNRLVNDRQLTARQRNELTHAIRHIKQQDDEIESLREDITDWEEMI